MRTKTLKPQIIVSTQAPRSAPRTAARPRLFDRDEGADRDLGEEFAGGVARQPDAAVGSGIIRNDSFVHSEIEAANPLQVGHLDFVDRRPMVAIFVGDDVLAPAGGKTFPPGGADRV